MFRAPPQLRSLLMSIGPYSLGALYTSTLERLVISSSQTHQLDIRILLLEFLWLFISASSVDVIVISLFCAKVYIT